MSERIDNSPELSVEAQLRRRRRWLQVSTVAGLVAAMVIAVLVNILAARHYRRLDVTTAALFTLSPVTEQTLGRLESPVDIVVLTGDSDPITLSLRHLLEAYGAETTFLAPRFIDPDRNPAAFLEVQAKYNLNAGRTEGGQVVTDAAIVVAMGERRHFIASGDLFAIDTETGESVRPELERALTTALRKVQQGEPPRVCFTRGHDELDIHVGGNDGALSLVGRLERANFEVDEIPPGREVLGDDPIEACALVIVAGPRRPLDQVEAERYARYFDRGGDVLVAVGPEVDSEAQAFAVLGLGPLLALGGLEADRNLVFELDPRRRMAQGAGDAFLAEPQPHPITTGFIDLQGAIPILLQRTRSLTKNPNASVVPKPLLTTSAQAFGLAELARLGGDTLVPDPGPRDRRGPLTLAWAIELPKRSAEAPHGPRMVVAGSRDILSGAPWTEEALRGAGLFVESAISWLADDPLVLDIPDKPARELGLQLTEETLRSALYEVVLALPLAALAIGLLIFTRRRWTEGRDEEEELAA